MTTQISNGVNPIRYLHDANMRGQQEISNGVKIIFSGGGTLGSVTPLLAIKDEILSRRPEAEFLWIGTKKGTEKELVQSYNIRFEAIVSAKLRRYFSLRNLFLPFFLLWGLFQSLIIVWRFRPGIIVGAGGYVSVPVVIAGWAFRLPSLVHQQDLVPGLANRLSAFFARRITVVFPELENFFPKKKTVCVGNPTREEILRGNPEKGRELFGLEKDLPVLLVLGGSAGAESINKLIYGAMPELVKFCQIIHLTGKDKGHKNFQPRRYHPYGFLTDKIADAYAVADLVISRAGMGTLTELSALAKPTILIPIPKTHQEVNANYFHRQQAVILLDQREMTPDKLVKEAHSLLSLPEELQRLSNNIKLVMPKDAGKKMVEEILKFFY